jgi:hypothetical protein
VSDGRWSDIEADTAAAVDHFSRAFDPNDAEPAVRATEKVTTGLVAAIAAYRQAFDPPP